MTGNRTRGFRRKRQPPIRARLFSQTIYSSVFLSNAIVRESMFALKFALQSLKSFQSFIGSLRAIEGIPTALLISIFV